MIVRVDPHRTPRRWFAALKVGVLASALACAAGCSVESGAPPTYQVPGTPDTCTGQVYFQVPAVSCFSFGCTTGTTAYALCEFGAFTTCSCENPTCNGFKPAPGSPKTDAAVPVCEAGVDSGEGGGDSARADAREGG